MDHLSAMPIECTAPQGLRYRDRTHNLLFNLLSVRPRRFLPYPTMVRHDGTASTGGNGFPVVVPLALLAPRLPYLQNDHQPSLTVRSSTRRSDPSWSDPSWSDPSWSDPQTARVISRCDSLVTEDQPTVRDTGPTPVDGLPRARRYWYHRSTTLRGRTQGENSVRVREFCDSPARWGPPAPIYTAVILSW